MPAVAYDLAKLMSKFGVSEWHALIDDALTVNESDEDRRRRLRHMRREVETDSLLDVEEIAPLVERIDGELAV